MVTLSKLPCSVLFTNKSLWSLSGIRITGTVVRRMSPRLSVCFLLTYLLTYVFGLWLNVLVNGFGHVGTLPPFYETFAQYKDVIEIVHAYCSICLEDLNV